MAKLNTKRQKKIFVVQRKKFGRVDSRMSRTELENSSRHVPLTVSESWLKCYSVFHQFREAKFGNGGSILSSSQFSLLPLMPQKTNKAHVKIGQNRQKIIGWLTTI
jgi:hypothetical protein